MDEFRAWWAALFAAADAAGLAVADMDEDFAEAAQDLPDGLDPSAVIALAMESGARSLLVDLHEEDLDPAIPETMSRTGGCVGFLGADGVPRAGSTIVHAGRFVT